MARSVRHKQQAAGRRLALARNPVRLALGLTRAELQALELKDRLHLDDLATGRGTAATLNELRMAATLSGRLAALGFGDGADAAAAEVALERAALDGVDAEHLAVLARMVDTLAAQVAAAPRGRVWQAAGLVEWR